MQFKMNNVATSAKGIEKANEMIVAGVRQEQAAKMDFADSLSQTFSPVLQSPDEGIEGASTSPCPWLI